MRIPPCTRSSKNSHRFRIRRLPLLAPFRVVHDLRFAWTQDIAFQHGTFGNGHDGRRKISNDMCCRCKVNLFFCHKIAFDFACQNQYVGRQISLPVGTNCQSGHANDPSFARYIALNQIMASTRQFSGEQKPGKYAGRWRTDLIAGSTSGRAIKEFPEHPGRRCVCVSFEL